MRVEAARVETTTLLVFALASAALVAVPGPNLLYIVTRSIAGGRRMGVACALGVEAGTLVWIGAAAVGLAALVASSAVAFNVVKWAGVVYLLFLGLRALRQPASLAVEVADGAKASLLNAFLQGLVVNLLNPKVALFFLAFLPQFIDPGATAAPQIAVLGVVFFVVALVIDLAYALGASAIGAWLRRRPAFVRHRHRVTGGVYLALAAVAASTGDGSRRG